MKFKCSDRCARCCKEFFVILTANDVKRIIFNHKLNFDDFVVFKDASTIKEDYRVNKCTIKTVDGDKVMGLKSTDDGCILLKDYLCTIYGSRPMLCRKYPFDWKYAVYGRTMACYSDDYKCDFKEIVPEKDYGEIFAIISRYEQDLKDYSARVREWNESKRKDRTIDNFLDYIGIKPYIKKRDEN